MAPVTICGFHHHIICTLHILRITDQRLMYISNIAGKYDLLLCIFLFVTQTSIDGGSQQMACIHKTYLDSTCRFP